MTVGRNSERKKIDQVLEAFAKFLNTRKDDRHKFKLYVHTNHIESCTGTDLVAQMMSLNIVDNTFFPSCFERNQVMLDKDLAEIYGYEVKKVKSTSKKKYRKISGRFYVSTI
jgi:glycosyltransferase involved in cell wall biosynthesis